MLKVPTIKDRAWQHLVKSAIEPCHEAHFHVRSYGFRPGRSCWDVQKAIFLNLCSRCNGISKRIVEVDIEKCFDRIDHATLMERLEAPYELKQGLWKALKTDASPGFPDQGTPQGEVISPLLANIALDGIENCGGLFRRPGKVGPSLVFNPGIRYTDDMVFIVNPESDPHNILCRIKFFLSKIGYQVSKNKTRIVAATYGFDFLGWNFRILYNGNIKITISMDSFRSFRTKTKNIINSSSYRAKAKAAKLAPVVRG